MRYGGHGKSNAKIYHIWVNMRQRCSNRSNPAWGRYGGRGIRVCERWESFALFLADMGEPQQGKSLDRINNDGNYEPSNCRWATASEQGNNTRVNHTLTINGETKSVKQWTEIHGIPYKTAMQRIYRGWPDGTIFGPLKHQGIGGTVLGAGCSRSNDRLVVVVQPPRLHASDLLGSPRSNYRAWEGTMTYRMQVRLPGDEESHLWEFTEATRDFATKERQQRIANYQVNWMAALGMCICIVSAIAVIALAVYLS